MMKSNLFSKIAVLTLLLAATGSLFAEEYVVEIVSADKTNQIYVLNNYGTKPVGATIDFESEYGLRNGATYNQIAYNTSAYLTLEGWGGCTINSVTVSMCSNKNSGHASMSVKAFNANTNNESFIMFTMSGSSFDSSNWYGEFVGHDNGYHYVDITKEMKEHELTDDEYAVVEIKGTKKENSVFIKRYTINYTPATDVEVENGLGYKYVKLAKSDTLADKDTVMIYYQGYAAGEIESLDSIGYFDAVKVASTSNVWENYVCHFVLSKQDANWLFINQYGDTLGASKANNSLKWNGGVRTWSIKLGSSSAEIANTVTNNGSIQYNAPSTSYARFTNYASSQVAPSLYRRVGRTMPTLATSMSLGAKQRELMMCVDTIILEPSFKPATTTDTRVTWKSLNEDVATVKDGIVKPVSVGTAKIVAISKGTADLADTCEVVVTDCNISYIEILDHRGKWPVESFEMYECEGVDSVLTLYYTPTTAVEADEIEWLTSDSTVVTVTSGRVKAVGAGNALVVAKSRQSDAADTCYVKVNPCVIEKISLKYPDTDENFSLKDCGGLVDGEGERFSISYAFEPTFVNVSESDFEWTSSDTAVATVFGSVGEITQYVMATVHAIAPGTATITCASAIDESIKAESTVTVVSCETALGEVKLSTIYTADGRIYADGDFEIYDITGRNVTELNGQLNGVYVVKLAGNSYKVVVKK